MMRLAEAAAQLSGVLHGPDAKFQGVTIDARALARGDLFVAVAGSRFDGHDFANQAAAAGAAGLLVHRPGPYPLPYILVSDTRTALTDLAHQWRRRFDIPVVGVTGSNGKTTVKGMLARILSETGPGTVTKGNLNNDLGVPLTLLRMRARDRFAVVEMGMNHPGEISVLTALAAPTVAVITNAAAAHLEGLGSVAAVAHAKGEIFAGLPDSGTAIINADDPYRDLWCQLAAPRRVLTFGSKKADVCGQASPVQGQWRLRLQLSAALGGEEREVPMGLLGQHNALNALAATAAALAAGAHLGHVLQGLSQMAPVPGRLEPVVGHEESLILNDTYNANPGSTAAAIAVLRVFPGPKILVLGDMLELGPESDMRHAEAGRQARAAGIDVLLTLGSAAAHAATAFGAHGQHFSSAETLCADLRTKLRPGMTVLVKGSRGMRMERIVQALSPTYHPEAH